MAGKLKSDVHDKIIKILEKEPCGRLLDVGSGGGGLANRAKDIGFDVSAFDADEERFQYHNEIEFKKGDLNYGLPFKDSSFDWVIMLEVIEHLKNPFAILREIGRVIKPGGVLLLSTPNILNIKSRFRFFFEGTFDYYREPPLESAKSSGHRVFDIHIFAYKYPELEYVLSDTGFNIDKIFSTVMETQARILSFFCLPLMKLQAYFKCRRTKKNRDIDYSRILKILFSPELLYSRHIIVKARKKG